MDDSVFVDRLEAAAELAKHEVRLEKFSGPLDLLLYLIRKDELDIKDIPIARITRQYLDYLDVMRALDLEVAGDYILMAATLIRIKAQMLLPRPELEGEEEDPRGRLVAALLEYQQFKEASGILHGYESDERQMYACSGDMPPRRVEETLSGDANVWDLVTVMAQLLKRSRTELQHEVVTDRYSVEEQIEFIRARLELRERLLLTELLGGTWTRGLLVTTFLALLELARLHILSIEQTAHFDDIVLSRRSQEQIPSALEGGE
jgi:segregation and condensation protein A